MAKVNWKPGNMLYPVPAVMVSCGRAGEKPNIITIAWTGTTCSAPAMVSISVRPERYSYGIIEETGEFVINLVTKELVYAADFCGVRSGRDVDKYEMMKLNPTVSEKVAAPGIAESPVNIECRVVSRENLGSHVMFLAEVVNVAVDDNYIDADGRFDMDRAGLVAYSHGEYFELGKKLGKFGFSVQKKEVRRKDRTRKEIQNETENRTLNGTAKNQKGKRGNSTGKNIKIAMPKSKSDNAKK